MMANRLSYFFDLKGPSMVVDTACSGSLVAFHLACQSIQSGECQTVLVGSANLILDPGVMTGMSSLG
jgi:acyl transferase domain-containing protein